MTRPYYVDEHKTRHSTGGRQVVEYSLISVNDGPLVFGTDLVFMHKLVDLLNEDANGADIHR